MNSDYKLNKPLQSYQADMAVTTNILSFIYYSVFFKFSNMSLKEGKMDLNLNQDCDSLILC